MRKRLSIFNTSAPTTVKPWLSINNASKKETVIDIDGEIGASFDWSTWELNTKNTKENIKQILNDVEGISSNSIYVNISSLGGDADHGFSIHDILAKHKATVTTDISGYTASAATIIAQSASKGKRRMSANAFYLIHKGISGVLGNANHQRALLDDLETFDNKLADLYARRSGKMDASFFLELMNANNGNGKWLSAEEALEYGLVDEVYEPNKKAVEIQNSAEIFNRLGLPEPPQISNSNSIEMKKEELLALFSNFKNEVTGMIANITGKKEGEAPTNEVKILDNEDFQKKISDIEKTITENTVPKADFEALKTEKESKETEISNLTTKVTNLEAQVAKYQGKPTPLDGEGDPDPETGNPAKTKNQIAAEKNAAALRNA